MRYFEVVFERKVRRYEWCESSRTLSIIGFDGSTVEDGGTYAENPLQELAKMYPCYRPIEIPERKRPERRSEVTKTLRFSGWLCADDFGDSDDQLFIRGGEVPVELQGPVEEPLGELLAEAISDRSVTAHCWISSQERKYVSAGDKLRQFAGDAKISYGARYGDGGYDEDVKIGGHDLLEVLEGRKGEWLILSIEVHG